jgi:hypothetical protein
MKLLLENGNTSLVDDNQLIYEAPFEVVEEVSTANTSTATLGEIQEKHIIPVYVKDNEPVISHAEFVEVATYCIKEIYQGEHILQPSIRVSHPIKGRVLGSEKQTIQ